MNKQNKLTIITAVSLILLLVYTVVCIKYTKNINPVILIVILSLIEFAYVLPNVIIKFYRAENCKLENKWTAFIPHYGATLIMNPIFAWISHGLIISLAVICLAMAFPVWTNIFGDTFVLMFPYYAPKIAVVLLFAYFVATGLGLYIATADIKILFNKAFPSMKGEGIAEILAKVYRIIPWLEILLWMLPVVRIIAEFLILDKLNSLDLCNMNVDNVEGGF